MATSAQTGRSVVFHQGGTPDERRDDKRGIDYVPTVARRAARARLGGDPGRISRPSRSTGGPAAGWYFDGGTRLNAPIKPALSLGAGG